MERNTRKVRSYFPILFPAALGLGTGLGALIHNVGVGLALGAGVGVAASLLAEWFVERRD